MGWTIQDDETVSERVLWASVLRRAVFDYIQYEGKPKDKRKWYRAKKYLFDDGVSVDGGASFAEVCTMHGWDKDYIRRIIAKLDRSDIKVLEPSRFKSSYITMYEKPKLPAHSRVWAITGSLVRLMPRFRYGKDFQHQLTPKPARITAARIVLVANKIGTGYLHGAIRG